jgi:TonB family protein
MLKAVLILTLLGSGAAVMAQGSRPAMGPVVSAYLTSLDEELNELEFQLRHGEIGRVDYERARRRLLVLRRVVSQTASSRPEDAVPELQVLAADEFSVLGSGAPAGVALLRPGDVIAERWKLLSIEAGRPPFYVLERLTEGDGLRAPRRAVRDPHSVIETIIVNEEAPPARHSPPEGETKTEAPPAPAVAPAVAPGASPPSAPVAPLPVIRRFYLPGYTREARAKGIEGEVEVSALFRRDGKIREIRIERALEGGLDEQAKEAVRRVEFEPARAGEALIDSRARFVFSFKLLRVTVRLLPAGRP